MRIIRGKNIDEVSHLIASEMINIERGEKIFEKGKIQKEPFDSYLSGNKNGVHFEFEVKKGFIAIPNATLKISNRISNQLAILTKQISFYPCKILCAQKENCIDTICTQYMDGFHDRNIYNNITLRSALHIDATKLYSFINTFRWYIGTYREILLLLDVIKIRNADISDLLRSVSCIVYDPCHIFQFKDNHLQVNFPLTSDLTEHPHFMTECLDIHPIYGVQWHIYKNKNVIISRCHAVPYDVYKENFANIDLIECILQLKKYKEFLLHAPKAVKLLSELFVSNKRKDLNKHHVCQICKTYLYDDIYVIELLYNKSTVHIGLCALCVHTRITHRFIHRALKFNNKSPHKGLLTMLKVTYPRTFKDVLILLNYSPLSIDIMNRLYELQGTLYYSNHTIWKDDISSISNAHELLEGTNDFKYLFICDICLI